MEYHAVVISIEYLKTKREIDGPHQSADNFASYLKACGITDIVSLSDSLNDPSFVKSSSPTKSNILVALKDLYAKCANKPECMAIVYFSGHGKKQGICPVDYKTKGIITDDDLHSLLVVPIQTTREFKMLKLRVFLDTCNSASLLNLPLVWKQGLKPVNKPKEEQDGDIISISASRDNQVAKAIQGKGLLTWALLDTLANSRETTPWRDIVTIVQAKISRENQPQVACISSTHLGYIENSCDLVLPCSVSWRPKPQTGSGQSPPF